MSGRILSNYSFLLDCIKNKALIHNCSFSQLEVLVEIVYNIISNNKVFLTNQECKTLKPVSNILREISINREQEEVRRLLVKLSQRQVKAIIKIAFGHFKL